MYRNLKSSFSFRLLLLKQNKITDSKRKTDGRARTKVSRSLHLFALMDNTNWGERYRTDAVRKRSTWIERFTERTKKKIEIIWFEFEKTNANTRGRKHETYNTSVHTNSTPHPQRSIEWWCLNVCQGTKSQLNCVITSMLVLVMTTSIQCIMFAGKRFWEDCKFYVVCVCW